MDDLISSLENGTTSSSAFVNKSISDNQSNPQSYLNCLQKRQQELEIELQTAVCANSDEFLQIATDVKHLRDNVSNLKTQVTRVRREALNVSTNLLGPFETIQQAGQQLNSMYATSKKLRKLIYFFEKVKNAIKYTKEEKIIRLNIRIKDLCSIWRIKQSGELDNILIFQQFWSNLRPKCESLIETAENQFNNSIAIRDLESATTAASVLLLIGRLESHSKSMYKRYTQNMTIDIQNNEKISADTVYSFLSQNFDKANDNLKRISNLYDTVSITLKDTLETDLNTNFDLTEIDPLKAVFNYSSNLKSLLNKSSRSYKNLNQELINKIPNLRKDILRLSQRLPPSIDQNSVFKIIVQAFEVFQGKFVNQTIDEMHKTFFGPFQQNSKSTGIDPKLISLNCESIQNKLIKYDKELLLIFKDPIVKLARDYLNLKVGSKDKLKQMVIASEPVVVASLQRLATKLFSDEAANEIKQLFST